MEAYERGCEVRERERGECQGVQRVLGQTRGVRVGCQCSDVTKAGGGNSPPPTSLRKAPQPLNPPTRLRSPSRLRSLRDRVGQSQHAYSPLPSARLAPCSDCIDSNRMSWCARGAPLRRGTRGGPRVLRRWGWSLLALAAAALPLPAASCLLLRGAITQCFVAGFVRFAAFGLWACTCVDVSSSRAAPSSGVLATSASPSPWCPCAPAEGLGGLRSSCGALRPVASPPLTAACCFSARRVCTCKSTCERMCVRERE